MALHQHYGQIPFIPLPEGEEARRRHTDCRLKARVNAHFLPGKRI
jgi:hypothetical protein